MPETSLFDELFNAIEKGDRDAAAGAAALAAATVAATLDEAQGLRALDGFLYADPDADVARRVSVALHCAWQSWSRSAESLLDHLAQLGASGRVIPRGDELEDAYGRAMALLKLSPEKIDRAREQVRRGEVYSIEEVRRELRVGARR